ncbi:MAG: EAL domain-containing protein [Rhodococcus sp. (in: high G+C Gram-positive bacteria)]
MVPPAPSWDSAPRDSLAGIESVYQPIVDLATGQCRGFEALTRPSPNSGLTTPEELFVEAARREAMVEFDWRCRVSALHNALLVGLPGDMALFVNSEPTALGSPPPVDALSTLAEAARLSVVVEITERHLMKDPAGLLRAASNVRDRGWRIAVDDVGADASSLALLALLRPDVIKLEMRFVHERWGSETKAILSSVVAEADRTGAIIVAEGIETEVHERRARELGATWGQGWLFGKPTVLPNFQNLDRPPATRPTGPAVTVRAPTAVTPFGLTHGSLTPVQADPRALEMVEDDLLVRALALGSTALVFITVSSFDDMSPARRSLVSAVAAVSAMTVVFCPAPAPPSDGGYRIVEVDPAEPMASERSVVVVDPMFNAAVSSIDVGSSGTVDYRLTFDRDHVLDAATLLLHRVPAQSQ